LSESQETFEAPLSDPDPFVLAKQVRGRVRECCGGAACAEHVEYLWIYVTEHGFGPHAAGADSPASQLPLEHWLNVVDEAAALGVRFLVVSVQSCMDHFPDLIKVCQWAQDAHEMTVVVHTTAGDLCREDVATLKQLDLQKLRLFVSRDAEKHLKCLEQHGIAVRIAEPDRIPREDCGMPAHMLFVNSAGQLYTCGMVEGNKDFHLGNIYESKFGAVVQDPALPHVVSANTPRHEHGCDGCPPLLANLLKGL